MYERKRKFRIIIRRVKGRKNKNYTNVLGICDGISNEWWDLLEGGGVAELHFDVIEKCSER